MTDCEIETTGLAPEEVFPRAEEYNPRGYTELEKKTRDKCLVAMMKDYPDLAGGQAWCEMIYDFVTHQEKTEEGRAELHDIINNKKWKNQKTKRNWKGGTVKCMENLTPEEYEEKYGKPAWVAKNQELTEGLPPILSEDLNDPSGN